MAYQYDVFLSYNRKFPHGDWVNDIFYPFFEPYLEDALNIRNVKIFKDREEIKSGQAWESKIQNALIHSKLLVAILSPAYFNSKDCKNEFNTMDCRQMECGYMTAENPNGLIIPLKVFDGDHFPDYMEKFNIFDCSDFFRLGPIKKCQIFIDFQDSLLGWVQDVAHAHKNAPVRDENWGHPDWIKKCWGNFDRLNGSSSSNKPPIL